MPRRQKPVMTAVPQLSADVTFEAFSEVYEQRQVVLIKNCVDGGRSATASSSSGGKFGRQPLQPRGRNLGMPGLRRVFAAYPNVVNRTFCIESKSSPRSPASSSAQAVGDPRVSKRKAEEMSAGSVLAKTRSFGGPWYASFVVQRSPSCLKEFLNALPFKVPPFLHRRRGVKHSDAAWVFFGQNPGRSALQGRPEHTDAIAHSGTWHLQLQGEKVWVLRPTAELMRQAKELRDVGSIHVRCEKGDVLCVNTRLWWHRTYLPGQCPLSLSVARDMWLDGTKPTACDMTNIDGHYAKRTIERGTVIFTEEDCPDLELGRSTQPNCELRSSRKSIVVVAKKRIDPGDWLCIEGSDEEDNEASAPQKKRRKANG